MRVAQFLLFAGWALFFVSLFLPAIDLMEDGSYQTTLIWMALVFDVGPGSISQVLLQSVIALLVGAIVYAPFSLQHRTWVQATCVSLCLVAGCLVAVMAMTNEDKLSYGSHVVASSFFLVGASLLACLLFGLAGPSNKPQQRTPQTSFTSRPSTTARWARSGRSRPTTRGERC